tara:strand:+ start:273 stop:443 length:171 start_codon:yes stop_codon:yes gene_type:complete
MKITAWKLVAYDEHDNEIIMDSHDLNPLVFDNKRLIPNHVATVIDDFLTEAFEEDE